MSDYIEMAQGKLGRVIVVRLRPARMCSSALRRRAESTISQTA